MSRTTFACAASASGSNASRARACFGARSGSDFSRSTSVASTSRRKAPWRSRGHAPLVEAVARGQLEAAEKFTGEQLRRLFQRRQRDVLAPGFEQALRPFDIDNGTERQKRHSLAIGDQPDRVRRIDNATQLGEAPSQGRARIVRAVPQQIAQRLARMRASGGNEIPEQRARAAGGRQRYRHTVDRHFEIADQSQLQRRLRR